VVDSFNGQIDAEMAKSALESAGIESMIQSDSGGGTHFIAKRIERPHAGRSEAMVQTLVDGADASTPAF